MNSESHLLVVGAAIIDDNRCLAARRGPDMDQPGVWEFPGGKIEPGETPEEALGRELREELGVVVEVGRLIATGTSVVGKKRITLDVYLARWVAGELELREHDRAKWVDASSLRGLDWARADLPAVEALSEILESE